MNTHGKKLPEPSLLTQVITFPLASNVVISIFSLKFIAKSYLSSADSMNLFNKIILVLRASIVFVISVHIAIQSGSLS
jgi:hypothetical protein